MSVFRIVVAGAAGRMGRALVRAVLEDRECKLAGALEAANHPELGTDAGTLAGVPAAHVKLTSDAAAALAAADALIDFTVPPVSVTLAQIAARLRKIDVVGTTGLSPQEEATFHALAQETAIVKSGNMSRGITLLASLVKQAAGALPGFDVEIVEMHHRMKADAPSGTALLLGRAAAGAREVALESEAIVSRSGQVGARKAGAIGFSSLRGGTVVGEHEVILAGEHERITLGHIAESRAIFALGAVAAAKWARSRPPGLYGMADVLGVQ